MSKRLEILELMTTKKPGDPFVWYARALELRSLERRDEALGALRDVAQNFPAYVPTYLMAAQLAAELGQVSEARELASLGIERARTAADGHALSELTSFLGSLSET